MPLHIKLNCLIPKKSDMSQIFGSRGRVHVDEGNPILLLRHTTKHIKAGFKKEHFLGPRLQNKRHFKIMLNTDNILAGSLLFLSEMVKVKKTRLSFSQVQSTTKINETVIHHNLFFPKK